MTQYRTVVETAQKNLVVLDVFSKLVQSRILFIDDVIDDELANGIIAQMLYLDAMDNTKPINIYINSPGGSIMNGMAIYDVSKIIKSPINTICIGMAASMAAILMLMGKERSGLKHSRIMLHEASGYNVGKTKDVEVSFNLQKELQAELIAIVREKTTLTDLEEMFKLDKWFKTNEALECGILTKIL